MKYYHATHKKNLGSILIEGIKPGIDGCVYLCTTPVDAVKFLVVKAIKEIVVFEVDLDKKDILESFDHSEAFFKCKAYLTLNHIDSNSITNVYDYSINN